MEAYLTQCTRQAKQQDIVNDAGITFSKTQELPELSSEQDPCGKGRDEKLFTQRLPEHNLSLQSIISVHIHNAAGASSTESCSAQSSRLGVKLCVKQCPLVGITRAAPSTQTPNTQTEVLLQQAFQVL